MRIVILTPLGLGGRGGIDRIMDYMRPQLSYQREVEVKFLVTRGSNAALSPLVTLGALVSFGWLCATSNVHVAHINLSQDASALRKILFGRCARFFSVPYVLHLHGSRFESFWKSRRPAMRWWVDDMFRHAASVIVLGASWQALVSELCPHAAPRVTILPNATPPFSGQIEPKQTGAPVQIIFLGRVGPRKGVPQLIAALAMLDKGLDWRAVIAGDGDVELTKLAVAEAGLLDRVSVPGWMGPDDVNQLMGMGDILALPSLAENLPMSVIEGMAAGMAIIATPVGATAEIIEPECTGLLVEPLDVPGLSAALARLIQDGDLRRRLGANAKAEHARRLGIDVFTGRLVEIWRKAAA